MTHTPAVDSLQNDFDMMRDVYMGRAQREAYSRIVSAALASPQGAEQRQEGWTCPQGHTWQTWMRYAGCPACATPRPEPAATQGDAVAYQSLVEAVHCYMTRNGCGDKDASDYWRAQVCSYAAALSSPLACRPRRCPMLSDAKVAAFRQQAADYMAQCAPDSFAYGKAIGILAVLNDLPAAEPADAGRDAAGWISQSALDAMNKCRDDDYIGYVEIWMRPSEVYSIPLYTRPPSEAAAVPRKELESLYRAYVRLLESGRNRIMDLGGECDPVDVMERSDIDLIQARAALASQQAVKP